MSVPLEKYYEFYNHGCAENAKTVVFLPGVAGSTWMFREAVPLFLPKFKVLILNNPGMAGTPLPVNLTVKKIAKLVVEIMQSLGLEKATFVGHSMGGFTAQTVAKIAPEMVEKLVLVSSSTGGSFTKEEVPRIMKDIAPNFLQRHKEFSENPEKGMTYVFSAHFMENDPVKYKMFAHKLFEMRPKKSYMLRHFVCAAMFSSDSFVEKIQAPTFIIHGEDDKLVHINGGKRLHEKIKGSKMWSVPHSGHFPMIENVDFYKKILSFVKDDKLKEI